MRTYVRAPLPVAGSSGPANGLGLLDFAKRVRELGDATNALLRVGRFERTSGRSRISFVASNGPLGLNSERTSAQLTSTEEINTVATSYSTHEPAFGGFSDSAVGVEGVYDGSNGDTTLTFEVVSTGSVGALLFPPRVRVTDGGGAVVDEFALGSGSVDSPQTLSNGLEVTFGSGSLVQGDSFELEVSASVGTSVDPDASFDGVGDARPEFDAGLSVTAGSFEVNGSTIAVSSSDTIRSVLAAINASDAGVQATFDAATESIVLEQLTPGSAATISLDNDTSGFLGATKLRSAAVQSGTDTDLELNLASVSSFAGLQSGTFLVNGTEFTIDVQADSLQDVLARINDANLGVTASYNAASDAVQFRGPRSGAMVLASGTSGFFDAVDVETGTYVGKRGSQRTRARDRQGVQRALSRFVDAFQKVSDGQYGPSAATVGTMQSRLTTAAAVAFDGRQGRARAGTLRSGLGLDLVTNRDRSGRRLEFKTSQLVRALDQRGADLAEFLFEDKSKGGEFDGLVTGVANRVEETLESLARLLPQGQAIGLRLDVSG